MKKEVENHGRDCQCKKVLGCILISVTVSLVVDHLRRKREEKRRRP